MIVISVTLLFFLIFLFSAKGRKDKEIKAPFDFRKIIDGDRTGSSG